MTILLLQGTWPMWQAPQKPGLSHETTEKPAIAAVQEHCMLPDKCADLAQFMLQKEYKSWFAAPPAARNVLGRSYTTGGFLCSFVEIKTLG